MKLLAWYVYTFNVDFATTVSRVEDHQRFEGCFKIIRGLRAHIHGSAAQHSSTSIPCVDHTAHHVIL